MYIADSIFLFFFSVQIIAFRFFFLYKRQIFQLIRDVRNSSIYLNPRFPISRTLLFPFTRARIHNNHEYVSACLCIYVYVCVYVCFVLSIRRREWSIISIAKFNVQSILVMKQCNINLYKQKQCFQFIFKFVTFDTFTFRVWE